MAIKCGGGKDGDPSLMRALSLESSAKLPTVKEVTFAYKRFQINV